MKAVAGQFSVASFVWLDNTVISSVGPHLSAPWSEGLEIDNCSAGLCNIRSQKVVRVTEGATFHLN